jgi:hypothetical protein
MAEGQRLREHLRRVGEAKASARAEDDAAHLALPPGERLLRVVRLSDTLRALSLAAGKADPPEDDGEVWLRVHRHLRGLGVHG